MKPTFNIEDRKPIWIALSCFYLDTELQDSDFRYIALKIIESPYSLEEAMEINKYELFPVLQPNLLSVAGVWDGFNETWLIAGIKDSLAKRNTLKRIGIEVSYRAFKWMCTEYWERLEGVYNDGAP